MSDKVIAASLSLNSNDANASIGNFKKALREANVDLLQMQQRFGELSPEAITAAKNVAKLKDQIGDAAVLVEGFNPDAKFRAFGNVVRGVAAGFSSLTGALALFGVQNEEVEKSLLKVQAALALSDGLNTLSELGDEFKRMKTVALDALKGIKSGIAATGVGLFLVALGTIVAYWDEIKQAVTGVDSAQRKLAGTTKEVAEAEREKLQTLDAQDNILKLQGKSEKDILKLKEKQTEQVIEKTILELNAAKQLLNSQVEAEKRNRDILKGILDFSAGGINIILKGIDYVGKVFGKNFGLADKLNSYVANMVFDPEATKAKGEEEIAQIDQTLTSLQNKLAGYQLGIKAIDDQAAKDAKDASDKAAAERKRKFDELVNSQKKDRADLQDQLDEFQKTKEEAAARALEEEHNRNVASMEDFLSTEQKKADAVKQNAEAEKILRDLELEHKKQVHAEADQLISNSIELLGKNTIAGKILGIAQATVNTYIGASEALKAKSVLPQPFDAISRIAAAAMIVVNGLKTVKSIVAVNVPGGGGGGSAPSMPTLSASAPLLPTLQQATNTKLPQDQINQISNATVRAFVVESDMTNSQQRVARLSRQARLGG